MDFCFTAHEFYNESLCVCQTDVRDAHREVKANALNRNTKRKHFFTPQNKTCFGLFFYIVVFFLYVVI